MTGTTRCRIDERGTAPPTIGLSIVDRRLERLVNTVLRPGLGETLEFDLPGLSTRSSVVTLDRLHLLEGKEQVSITAESFQSIVIERGDLDAPNLEGTLVTSGKGVRQIGLAMDGVDDRIGQQPSGQAMGAFWRHARELPPHAGPDLYARGSILTQDRRQGG